MLCGCLRSEGGPQRISDDDETYPSIKLAPATERRKIDTEIRPGPHREGGVGGGRGGGDHPRPARRGGGGGGGGGARGEPAIETVFRFF